MTVAELIQRLQEYDQELEILVYNEFGDPYEIEDIVEEDNSSLRSHGPVVSIEVISI